MSAKTVVQMRRSEYESLPVFMRKTIDGVPHIKTHIGWNQVQLLIKRGDSWKKV